MESLSLLCLSKEFYSSSRKARKQLLYEALLAQPEVKEILYANPPRHRWQPKATDCHNPDGLSIWQGTLCLPGERLSWVRALNRWHLHRRIQSRLSNKTSLYSIFYNPFDAELARRLKSNGRVIMDWTDDWALYYKNPQINPIQDSVVRMASGVIVVNERLKQRASRLREGADNVFMLPNATALKPCKHLPCPADISQIPMPRIGYCGHLGPWFDPEVINEIARARPQWQWVMVGYLNSEAQKVLSGLPNVHLLGPRKFDELQAYMAQCQVLASPYKENFEGDATKLYDYLTVGAPIVSSAIETAYRLQPYVKVVSDVGSWIEAIQQSLSEKNGGLREARQEESLKHSWNARSAALIDWLYRL